MEKFIKLGLSKALTATLEKAGFKEPTKIQEKAIPPALEGKDIVGGSETGSGKTLAFSSAIIENLKPNEHVQAIILTPTRELAVQVANSIKKFSENKDLNILSIYGGTNIEPQIRKIRSADIIVGTPGRVLDHLNKRTLRLDHIKFLVLDEVDRMFDMGFRRDVERIIEQCPIKRQTMMFSATISPEVTFFVEKYTKDPEIISLKSFVDPKKLTQVYYDIPDRKKFSLLVHLLEEENANLVMVFCNTRRSVDFISDNLEKAGFNAKAIHGGLDQRKRIRVLKEFHHQGLGILVCTDVAARGLDIKGVSHVYNYDIPTEPKEYIHRIGRTARAGKQGKAITILASRDYEKFGNLTQSREIHITPEKTPQVEIVHFKTNQKSNFRKRPSQYGNNRGRNNSRNRKVSRPTNRSSRRPNSRKPTGKRNNFRNNSRKKRY